MTLSGGLNPRPQDGPVRFSGTIQTSLQKPNTTILLDIASVRITGDLDVKPFFLDGNVNEGDWHNINGGDRVLIVPGYGALHFTEGPPQSHMPSPSIGITAPPDDPFYHMRIINAARTVQEADHQTRQLQLGIDGDGVVSGPGPDPVGWFLAHFKIPLIDGSSWLRQSRTLVGDSVTIFYDTTWYTENGLGQDLEVAVILSSDVFSAMPTKVVSRPLPQGRGTLVIDGLPQSPGTYTLKTFLNGRSLLSHGDFFVHSSTPPQRGIRSIAGGFAGTTLHFYAAVTERSRRTMWHYTTSQSDLQGGTWTHVEGSRQSIIEVEVIITADGTPMLFALDDGGYVHMRMGETAWHAAPWAGQSVPFEQLTVSGQRAMPKLIAMDQMGGLWTTQQTDPLNDVWSSWDQLPAVSIDGESIVLQDLGSAGQMTGGVDDIGRAMITADHVKWIVASVAPGQPQVTFIAADITLEATSGSGTLWLVDQQGNLWRNATPFVAGNTTIEVSKEMTAVPPVPLSSVFCAVSNGSTTHIWSTSRDIEIWKGTAGQPTWEGPTWSGLRSVTLTPLNFKILDLASNNTNTPAPRCFAFSGTALWMKEPISDGTWTAWQVFDVATLPQPVSISHIGRAVADKIWAVTKEGHTWVSGPVEDHLHGGVPLWTADPRIDADFMVSTVANSETYYFRQGRTVNLQLLIWPRAMSPTQISTVKVVSMSAITSLDAARHEQVTFIGLTKDGSVYDMSFDDGASTVTPHTPAFGLPPPPSKLIEVRLRASPDGNSATALALDAQGHLWATEKQQAGWTQLWQGPRVYGQPAQFASIEASMQYLVCVDTFGSIWTYSFVDSTWSGRDWEGSSVLAATNPPSVPGHPATTMRQAAASAVDGTTTATEMRSSTYDYRILPDVALNSSGQMKLDFTLDVGGSSVISTINGPRKKNGTAFWLAQGRKKYPLATDNNLQEIGFPVKYKDSLTKGIFHPLVELRPSIGSFALTVDGALKGEAVMTVDVPDSPRSQELKDHECHQPKDEGITGIVVTRKPPALDDVNIVQRVLVLRINWLLVWTRAHADADKTRFRKLLIEADGIFRKIYRDAGDLLDFPIAIEHNTTHPVEITLPTADNPTWDFTSDPIASLLRDHGSNRNPTIIWTPKLDLPAGWTGGGAPVGMSGGIACVPMPDNRAFGVLIQLRATMQQESSEFIAKNTAHELGHLLGLSHASSEDVPGNLMRPKIGQYGRDLNDKQRYILRMNPLLEETYEVRQKNPKVSFISVEVGTYKDPQQSFLQETPGTDRPVTLEFCTGNNPGTLPIFTYSLDTSGSRFEAGTTTTCKTSVPDGSQFLPRELGMIRVKFDPGWFDAIWEMESLVILAATSDNEEQDKVLLFRDAFRRQFNSDNPESFIPVVEHRNTEYFNHV